jgi:cell division protein FtsB
LQWQLTTSDIALTENAKLKTANEKLTSTNSDLQKQVETLDAARSSWVEQLNEAIATKIETERENTELIWNNEELLKQIEAYKKKISELQGNNSKLKEELGETKDALDSVVAAKIDID